MAGSAKFPEVVFLRRGDNTGYGFFYYGEADYLHAVESFRQPILRSFNGTPIEGQPDPLDHLRTAMLTFLGQAFDHSVSADIGAEGVSRAAAAMVRESFPTATPRIVVIERKEGPIVVRPGLEYLRHDGYPKAVVVNADTHGGEAHFYKSAADYEAAGAATATARCWLPQIIFRLYARTPSVMVGQVLSDKESGRHSVACRGMDFGLNNAPVERAAAPS